MDETRDPFGVDRTTSEQLPAGHALPGAEPRTGDSPVYNSGSETGGGASADAAYTGGAGAANDPDATRAEIEQTRARMSETIDEIEEQLLRRKQTIEEKLDVKSQVRERLAPLRAKLAPAQEQVYRRPLAVFGGVFGAGLLLGYLTGDDDHESRGDRKRRASASLAGSPDDADYESEHRIRARRWEEQSRRLMKQNSEQEEELRRLRARLEAAERRAARTEGREEERTGWRHSLGSAIGGVFSGLLGQMGGRTHEEYDVEVEVRTVESEYDMYSPNAAYESGSYPRRGGTGYSESEYGGTGSYGAEYPQRGFSQGAHYDAGLEDGGYESSTDYRTGYSSEYDEGDGYRPSGPGSQRPG